MLTQSHPTLPSSAYFDSDLFDTELRAIWHKEWLCVGHVSEWIKAGTFRKFTIGDQEVIVVRDRDGDLRAFHNTCRHRGAQLCQEADGKFRAGRITCPYHAWAYGLDGRLLKLPGRWRSEGFEESEVSLYPVSLEIWRGFAFINLNTEPKPFTQSLGSDADSLLNWPLEQLALAHREHHDVACNWKVFWENFLECYHCAGVHPRLSSLVPHYAEGTSSRDDLPEDHPLRHRGSPLRDGAVTWSADGQTELPDLPGLDGEDRQAGMTFVTSIPTGFLVAHRDYVRMVRIHPLTSERTRLEVDWYLMSDTLEMHSFDRERLTEFGRQVVGEDARICEINQRGLHSRPHQSGVLMPTEYDVLAFHLWWRARMPGFS